MKAILELKPCPFCNTEVNDWGIMYGGSSTGEMEMTILCRNCETEFNLHIDEYNKSKYKSLEEIWNARPRCKK